MHEKPILRAPEWNWKVSTYLFMGGIMGGLGLLALVARPGRPDERRLRRTIRFVSLALAAANPGILITHLGRPERFHHMLRIVKYRSPMSLGVWGLVLYSGAAGANVLRELAETGSLPSWVRNIAPTFATPLQALMGAFTAGYTGVLLSASAIPVWAAGKRHIPAASVCSGLSGACALASLLALIDGNDDVAPKLERLEMVASTAELYILKDFRKKGGRYVRPLFEGAIGERLSANTIERGIAVPIVLNLFGELLELPKPLDRVRRIAASVLTLVGGYIFRDCLVESGKISARDRGSALVQPR
jgi:formate-dependent nitrite reductase membrane component NrfD